MPEIQITKSSAFSSQGGGFDTDVIIHSVEDDKQQEADNIDRNLLHASPLTFARRSDLSSVSSVSGAPEWCPRGDARSLYSSPGLVLGSDGNHEDIHFPQASDCRIEDSENGSDFDNEEASPRASGPAMDFNFSKETEFEDSECSSNKSRSRKGHIMTWAEPSVVTDTYNIDKQTDFEWANRYEMEDDHTFGNQEEEGFTNTDFPSCRADIMEREDSSKSLTKLESNHSLLDCTKQSDVVDRVFNNFENEMSGLDGGITIVKNPEEVTIQEPLIKDSHRPVASHLPHHRAFLSDPSKFVQKRTLRGLPIIDTSPKQRSTGNTEARLHDFPQSPPSDSAGSAKGQRRATMDLEGHKDILRKISPKAGKIKSRFPLDCAPPAVTIPGFFPFGFPPQLPVIDSAHDLPLKATYISNTPSTRLFRSSVAHSAAPAMMNFGPYNPISMENHSHPRPAQYSTPKGLSSLVQYIPSAAQNPMSSSYAGQTQSPPHVLHVPVFREKKQVYLKRQHQGCCGVLNALGWCDAGTGLVGFKQLNVGGCCDRERVLLVDDRGKLLKKKRSWWCVGQTEPRIRREEATEQQKSFPIKE